MGVTAVILGAAIIYLRGWRKLQQYRPDQQSPQFVRATHRALAAFLAGLALLSVALVSPLHTLASQYFSMRVTQHLLLIAWIPSLILAANPAPIIWQGLPASWRRRYGKRPSLHPILFQTLHIITAPGAALFIFVSVFWLWYDPVLHQTTVRYAPLRVVEVVTLLGAAGFYWWHITGALPRNHKPLPWVVRVIYTFIGVVAIKFVGLIVMFSEVTLFPYPSAFYVAGLDLDDQRLGGIIFWVLGGAVYATTALLLIRRWLSQEEGKPGLPESNWATEEAMLAPGLKK